MARSTKTKPFTRQAPRATTALPPWWPSMSPWAGPLVISLVALAMLRRGWWQYADPLIDFGREVYIPWRLAEGQVLYRDLAYFNGPLSPYFHAVVFRLFGASLRVVAVSNALITGGLLLLLYALLARIGSRFSALLGCLTFSLVFGFSQYTGLANYNYICPYSYELTHGIALSLLALLLLGRWVRTRHSVDLIACGITLGLVFLTKPEVLMAATAAIGVGLALTLWATRPPPRQLVAVLAAFASAASLPPLIALALLSLAMPIGAAGLATLGGLRYMFDPAITSLPFYRESAGILDLSASLRSLLLWTAAYAALLAPAAAVGWLWRRPSEPRSWAAAIVFAVVLSALIVCQRQIPLFDVPRPLPVVLLVAATAVIARYARLSDASARLAHVLPAALTVFALALMTKMVFNARIHQYGFGLAMPATMLLIVALWDWVPRALARGGGDGWLLRAAFLAALVVFVGRFAEVTDRIYRIKSATIGAGGDTIRCDPAIGGDVERVLAAIRRRVPADGTLAVVPEGVIMNFLTRRVNPTRFITLMPPEVIMFGEDAMLDSFQRHPPDFLVWTQESAEGYGFRMFGAGYAERLAAWLRDNYTPLEVFVEDSRVLPMMLLERNPAAAAGEAAVRHDGWRAAPVQRPAAAITRKTAGQAGRHGVGVGSPRSL